MGTLFDCTTYGDRNDCRLDRKKKYRRKERNRLRSSVKRIGRKE
jgi:hypothetical protein